MKRTMLKSLPLAALVCVLMATANHPQQVPIPAAAAEVPGPAPGTVMTKPYVQMVHRGQDPENQLQDLRAWCAAAGHAVSREYIDYESGRKAADKRKQFAALFDDATKRKFDCVLFWALDRFSREGMAQTIIHLQRLSSYDIAFHSYTEPHLATDNELVRNVLLALLSSLAKVEAQKISERTKAGMARAQANGIRIGRPKIELELRQKIAQRAAKGETAYSIAKALGIDRHTAVKYAR